MGLKKQIERLREWACECCGKEGKLEAHHWDYDRPLSVVWLCYRCHGMYHKAKYDDTRGVKEAVEKLIERKRNNERTGKHKKC